MAKIKKRLLEQTELLLTFV